MLDKLVDLLIDLAELFFFLTVVREWESGIVLRFGRYHRELEPGPHFHWPFHIERPLKVSVVPDATRLDEQKFTISDGSTVAAKATVVYRVRNAKRFLLEVEDAEASMLAATCGVLRRHLMSRTWSQLSDEVMCREIEEAAATEMKKEASRWGVEILRVQFPDLARLDSVIGIYGVSR